MNLKALHKEFCKDASYVRAYAGLGGAVELALHCRAVREERGLTQAELAAECGVTAHAVSRFERLHGGEDRVIGAILHGLEPWLRRRGVATEGLGDESGRGRAVRPANLPATARGTDKLKKLTS